MRSRRAGRAGTVVAVLAVSGYPGMVEIGRPPSCRQMATGALRIAGRRDVVGLRRGKAVASRRMAARTTGRAGMVHRCRRPSPADRMATGASIGRHRRRDVRFCAHWLSAGIDPVVAAGAITGAGDTGVIEAGRQPGYRQVATRTLGIARGRNMVGLGRGKAVACRRMTTGATGRAGMVHGRR